MKFTEKYASPGRQVALLKDELVDGEEVEWEIREAVGDDNDGGGFEFAYEIDSPIAILDTIPK